MECLSLHCHRAHFFYYQPRLTFSYLTILVMKLRGPRSSEMGVRTRRMHTFEKHESNCMSNRRRDTDIQKFKFGDDGRCTSPNDQERSIQNVVSATRRRYLRVVQKLADIANRFCSCFTIQDRPIVHFLRPPHTKARIHCAQSIHSSKRTLS